MVVPGRAQPAPRDNIDASAESFGQFSFDPQHLRGPDRRAGRDIDEHVDIASRTVISAGDRAEHGCMDHSYCAQPRFTLPQRDQGMAQERGPDLHDAHRV